MTSADVKRYIRVSASRQDRKREEGGGNRKEQAPGQVEVKRLGPKISPITPGR